MQEKIQDKNGFLEDVLKGDYGNSVAEILSKHGYDAIQIDKIETEIDDMLSKISNNLELLKNSGKSREAWLSDRLGQYISDYKIEDPHAFISGISESLPETELRFKLNENSPMTSQYFDQFISIVSDGVVKSSSISIARDLQSLDINLSKEGIGETEIPMIRDMLKKPLGNPREKETKRILSAGMIIMKDQSDIPAFNKVSNSMIVASVDRGVDNVVFAAHVASEGTDHMDLFDAIGEIFDRNVARACSIVEKTCEEFGANAGYAAGVALGDYIGGPVAGQICGKIGEVVGRFSGKIIGKVISKGVNIIADVVKSAARNICDGAVYVYESVIDFIFG